MKIQKTILFLLLLISSSYLQAQLIITKSVNQPTCNNNNGSISISVTGGLSPYFYEWTLVDDDQVFSTNPSISNLYSGVYAIKVTDSNNEYEMDSIVVRNGISAYIQTISPALCPQNNGIVEAFVQGGISPYSYSWSNGATTKSVSNLAGGEVLQLEIKDANGCNAYGLATSNNFIPNKTFEITVNEISNINFNYTTTPEECPLNNGTISVIASGGVAPYTYYWNTTPVKSTATITGLTTGYYTGTVTDAQGCKQNLGNFVNKNAGALNVWANKTNDYCSKKQGSASLNISGGVPPYNVHWPDGSSALTKTGLEYGLYSIDVTDQNNCVFNLPVFIDDLSPVNSWTSTTETNCDNISGNAYVNVSGGTAPYNYKWNNGVTNSSITALPKGYYSVLVKDANGCKSTSWAYVNINSNCYATISGKLFQDDNGNCVQESGEYPIMNQYLNMNSATASNYLFDYYDYTDWSGQYSMRYVLPDMYTVKYQNELLERTYACPASGAYNLTIPTSGINYLNNDFAMKPNSLFEDAKLLYNFCNAYTPPRPGFNYTYNIPFKNNGTLFSDGFIEVVYGNLETFVSSSPAADYYDPTNKTLRFNYSNLMLGEIRGIQLTFNLPPTTLLGSTYNHTVKADIGTTDPTPQNNFYSYPFTVVGSFDPNDLRVTPTAIITEEDEVLTYSIRFQNTGTYPAELVLITDVIDQNLDILSITDITASHAYKFSVGEGRTIKFAFENINLADEKRDEPSSHGFVTFKIRKKAHLALGTEIKNTSNIYFDYNDPIITNTTINTMGIATGIINGKTINTGLVYPNPATDYTVFRFDASISKLQLITVTGTEVLNEEIADQNEFGMKLNLSKGMYLYKAYSSEGNTYTGKLIIE